MTNKMLSLTLGALIGFVLAIPPGPVAVTVMASALRGRWRHGIAAAASAATADGVLAVAVLFASSALVAIIEHIIARHPAIAVVAEIGIIAGLVTYAIRLGKSSLYDRSSDRRENVGHSVYGTIATAATTAFANVINPTYLPSIAATFTAAHTLLARSATVSIGNKLLMAVGFALGTFGWFVVVVAVILRHHQRFSLRNVALLRRIGAAIVLTFAAVLLWHVAQQG